jgi:hypothetical protein
MNKLHRPSNRQFIYAWLLKQTFTHKPTTRMTDLCWVVPSTFLATLLGTASYNLAYALRFPQSFTVRNILGIADFAQLNPCSIFSFMLKDSGLQRSSGNNKIPKSTRYPAVARRTALIQSQFNELRHLIQIRKLKRTIDILQVVELAALSRALSISAEALKRRLTHPELLTVSNIYFLARATNLKPNDLFLLIAGHVRKNTDSNPSSTPKDRPSPRAKMYNHVKLARN